MRNNTVKGFKAKKSIIKRLFAAICSLALVICPVQPVNMIAIAEDPETVADVVEDSIVMVEGTSKDFEIATVKNDYQTGFNIESSIDGTPSGFESVTSSEEGNSIKITVNNPSIDASDISCIVTATNINDHNESYSQTINITVDVKKQINTVDLSADSTSLWITSASPNPTTSLNAIAKDSNGNTIDGVTISFSSSNEGVASIDGSVLKGNSVGTSIITATASYNGINDYSKSSEPVNVEVKKSANSLSIQGEDSIYINYVPNSTNSTTLLATTDPNDASGSGSITWSSNNNNISVDNNGVVTATAPGRATITAEISEVNNGGVSVSDSVDVVFGQVTVSTGESSAVIYNNTTECDAFGTYPNSVRLSALIDPNEGSLQYSSSLYGIAEVDQNGLVTAVENGGLGTTTITASLASNGEIRGTTGITVKKLVRITGITRAAGKEDYQKIFDGTDSIEEGVFDITLSDNAVSITGGVSFKTAQTGVGDNVGVEVVFDNVTLSNDNYVFVQDTSQIEIQNPTINIIKKPVNITGIEIADKYYDGEDEFDDITYIFDDPNITDLSLDGVEYKTTGSSAAVDCTVTAEPLPSGIVTSGSNSANYDLRIGGNPVTVELLNGLLTNVNPDIKKAEIILTQKTNGEMKKNSDGLNSVPWSDQNLVMPQFDFAVAEGKGAIPDGTNLTVSINDVNNSWRYESTDPGTGINITGIETGDFVFKIGDTEVENYTVTTVPTVLGSIIANSLPNHELDLSAGHTNLTNNLPNNELVIEFKSGNQVSDGEDDDNENDYWYGINNPLSLEGNNYSLVDGTGTELNTADLSTGYRIEKNDIYIKDTSGKVYGPISVIYSYDNTIPKMDKFGNWGKVESGNEVTLTAKALKDPCGNIEDNTDTVKLYNISDNDNSSIASLITDTDKVSALEAASAYQNISATITYDKTGEVNLYCVIKDKAGNICLKRIDSNILKDNSAPSVSIVTAETHFNTSTVSGVTYNSGAQISITAEENGTYNTSISDFKIKLYDGCGDSITGYAGDNVRNYSLSEDQTVNLPDIDEYLDYLDGRNTEVSPLPNLSRSCTYEVKGYQLSVLVYVRDIADNEGWYVISFNENETAYILNNGIPVDTEAEAKALVDTESKTFKIWDTEQEAEIIYSKAEDPKTYTNNNSESVYVIDPSETELSFKLTNVGTPTVNYWVNDEEITVTAASYSTQEHCYIYNNVILSFDEEKEYKLEFAHQDGNTTDHTLYVGSEKMFGKPATKAVVFADRTRPEVDVDYVTLGNPEEIVSDINGKIYSNLIKAVITISDKTLPALSDYNMTTDANEYVTVVARNNSTDLPVTWTDATEQNSDTITYKAEILYSLQGNCSLLVSANDLTKRSNKSQYGTDQFVIDTAAPTLSVSYNESSSDESFAPYYYYGLQDGTGDASDVQITLTLQESNSSFEAFKSALTIYRNGSQIGLGNVVLSTDDEWVETPNSLGIKHTVSIIIPGAGNDGEYRIGFDYTDPAGNKLVYSDASKASYVVDGIYSGNEHISVIDTIRPKAELGFSAVGKHYEDADYYNKPFTGYFTITEANFDERLVTAGIKSNGDFIASSVESVDGKQQYEMAIPTGVKEGKFTYTIEGKDKAGNKMEVVAGSGSSSNDGLPYSGVDVFESGLRILATASPEGYMMLESGNAARPYIQEGRYYLNDEFNVKIVIKGIALDENDVYLSVAADTGSEDYAGVIETGYTRITDYTVGDDGSYIYTYKSIGNGLYRFNIKGEDKAGNKITFKNIDAEGKELAEEKRTFETIGTGEATSFYISSDTVSPKVAVGIDEFYAAVLSDTGYSISRNYPYRKQENATIRFNGEDKSPTNVRYKVVSTVEGQNKEASSTEVYQNGGYSIELPMNGRQTFSIDVLEIVDRAGNSASIQGRTNKIYLDTEFPTEDSLSPTISISGTADSNGIGPAGNPLFRGDVTLNVTVTDPEEAVASSGLYRVYYSVTMAGNDMTGSVSVASSKGSASNGTITYGTSGESYNPLENPSDETLVYTDSLSFSFSSATFNNNDIKIRVWAEDNAGNGQSQGSGANYSFGIDTTAPQIVVTYDNNDVQNEKYFKETRTATIRIKERNFSHTNTVISTEPNAIIGAWVRNAGAASNGDDDEWVTRVEYSTDGDYTFDVKTADLLGQAAGAPDYGTSVVPNAFTIDKTVPVINIAFDNNNAVNGHYYDDNRLATVTITEHNFSNDGAEIETDASIARGTVSAPQVNGWGKAGDTNTATIAFNDDGDYAITANYTDLAGNVAEEVVVDRFTIDKEAPELIVKIDGEEYTDTNRIAYTDDVILSIEYSDTNFDPENTKVELVGINHQNASGLVINSEEEDAFGKIIGYQNIPVIRDNDDVYTARIEVRDLAGHTTPTTIVFSVNRFGSNYILSDDTKQLVDKYYTNQQPTVVVTEISVVPVQEEITYDIDEDSGTAQHTTTLKHENDGWYEYEYSVSPVNFDKEGLYILTFRSVDEEGRVNMNRSIREDGGTTKEQGVEFFRDVTAPSVSILGLNDSEKEEDRRYKDVEKSLVINYSDSSYVESMSVKSAGVSESFDIDTLRNGNGELQYTAQASKEWQKVTVEATDAAGNSVVIESPEFLLTDNFWIQYVNNKPLFIGSISGIGVVGAAVVFFLVGGPAKIAAVAAAGGAAGTAGASGAAAGGAAAKGAAAKGAGIKHRKKK